MGTGQNGHIPKAPFYYFQNKTSYVHTALVHSIWPRHCEDYLALTGWRMDFGLILLMLLYTGVLPIPHVFLSAMQGPVSIAVSDGPVQPALSCCTPLDSHSQCMREGKSFSGTHQCLRTLVPFWTICHAPTASRRKAMRNNPRCWQPKLGENKECWILKFSVKDITQCYSMSKKITAEPV